jgi:hypothetical protein
MKKIALLFTSLSLLVFTSYVQAATYITEVNNKTNYPLVITPPDGHNPITVPANKQVEKISIKMGESKTGDDNVTQIHPALPKKCGLVPVSYYAQLQVISSHNDTVTISWQMLKTSQTYKFKVPNKHKGLGQPYRMTLVVTNPGAKNNNGACKYTPSFNGTGPL